MYSIIIISIQEKILNQLVLHLIMGTVMTVLSKVAVSYFTFDKTFSFITLHCSIIRVCFYTKTPDTDFGVNSQKHGQSKIKSTTLEQGRQITLQNPILYHKSNATCRMTRMLLTSLWKSFKIYLANVISNSK